MFEVTGGANTLELVHNMTSTIKRPKTFLLLFCGYGKVIISIKTIEEKIDSNFL